jgi:hypothetical protein
MTDHQADHNKDRREPTHRLNGRRPDGNGGEHSALVLLAVLNTLARLLVAVRPHVVPRSSC